MTRRGLLLILSSPSGAGKSTLARMLMAWDPSLRFSVSATTRAPRPNEVDGREYFFLSREQFADQVHAGDMLEHAEVFANQYGSPAAPVKEALVSGRDMIFDIDWQGGQQIKNSALGSDVVSVFILPPSIEELERRLKSRAQDSADVIAARMAKSRNEISHWAEYDYVLVNNELERCFDELKSILQVERMRRARQPRLVDFIRTLNAEFESR
jgi:guanylate kinase